VRSRAVTGELVRLVRSGAWIPAPNWSKLVGQVNVQRLDNACLSGEMKQVVAADAWNIGFNMKIRSEEPSGLVCTAAQLNSVLGSTNLHLEA
jgi:hypothetical protein